MWEIEFTNEFHAWWNELSVDQQRAIEARIELLEAHGPSLGRPVVDRIQASRHHNMKELRSEQADALRVLFMFDPRRKAILLLGGDKSGQWDEWYEWAIPAADDLYDTYLNELRKEGLL
jgi:hypothetical protein